MVGCLQTRVRINFNQPALHFLIDNYVEAEQLETIATIFWVELASDTAHGRSDDFDKLFLKTRIFAYLRFHSVQVLLQLQFADLDLPEGDNVAILVLAVVFAQGLHSVIGKMDEVVPLLECVGL